MIPKSFQIGPHTIKIKKMKLVRNQQGEEVLGVWMPLQNEIRVSTFYNGEAMSEEAVEHSYWHEVSHCVMTMLSEWDFNANEVKIDMMGLFLSQINKSKKY